MTREEAIREAEAHANEAQATVDAYLDAAPNATAHATISLAFSALAALLPPEVIQL